MTQTYQLSLADRIRAVRKSMGLTRSELARVLSVSQSAVAQWEHPQGSSPNSRRLVELAQRSGVAFEWLSTGRGHRQVDARTPAVDFATFAHDDAEEQLLLGWRALSPALRESVVRIMRGLNDGQVRRAGAVVAGDNRRTSRVIELAGRVRRVRQ